MKVSKIGIEEGNPIEMPEDRTRMIWSKGFTTLHKEYELDEFTDDFEKVLKPWYMRQ